MRGVRPIELDSDCQREVYRIKASVCNGMLWGGVYSLCFPRHCLSLYYSFLFPRVPQPALKTSAPTNSSLHAVPPHHRPARMQVSRLNNLATAMPHVLLNRIPTHRELSRGAPLVEAVQPSIDSTDPTERLRSIGL